MRHPLQLALAAAALLFVLPSHAQPLGKPKPRAKAPAVRKVPKRTATRLPVRRRPRITRRPGSATPSTGVRRGPAPGRATLVIASDPTVRTVNARPQVQVAIHNPGSASADGCAVQLLVAGRAVAQGHSRPLRAGARQTVALAYPSHLRGQRATAQLTCEQADPRQSQRPVRLR